MRPFYRRPVRIGFLLVAALLALVLLLHLLLPSLLLRFANRQLAQISGYRGHIEDVDISLLRGAYQLQGVTLRKVEGGIPVPFFDAKAVDLSLEWGALFQGKIVGEITLDRPRLNFVAGPTPAQSQTDAPNWRAAVEDLLPITINRFEIFDGSVHFLDLHSRPKVDLRIDRIHAVAKGLTNAQESGAPLPATFHAAGRAMEHARLRIDMGIAPLAEYPTFDLDAELTDLRLTTLNDFLRAYAALDAEGGTLGLFVEAAAADGAFQGYVKPLLRDVDILDLKKDSKNPVQLAWEAMAGAVAEIFENQPREQVATRVEFSGRVDAPDADIWKTVGNLLRNAFVRALRPGVEDRIRLKDGPDKREEKRQKKKEAKKS
jgi:hypothetical protein